MWCIVSGSGSPARYTPGGFWSRTAPRISTRSSPRCGTRGRGTPGRGAPRALGIGGRISSVQNMCEHCYRRDGPAVDPGYRRPWASIERLILTGATTSSWCRSPPSTPSELLAAASVDRSSYGFTEVPGDAEHMARYIDNLLAPRPPPAPTCRSPSAASPTAGSSAAPATSRSGAGGDGPSPTRSRSAARGSAPTPSAPRSTPRPSCSCSPTPSSVWHVDRVAIATDARNERSRTAIERLGASLRRHPAPPPPVARRRARPDGPATPPCSRSPTTTGRRSSRACSSDSPPSHDLRSRLMEVLVVCAHPHAGQLQPRHRRRPSSGACAAGRPPRHDARPLRPRLRRRHVRRGAPGLPRRRSPLVRPDGRRARRAGRSGRRPSCSSTRRGGASRRRSSRAGSSGCCVARRRLHVRRRGQGAARRCSTSSASSGSAPTARRGRT